MRGATLVELLVGLLLAGFAAAGTLGTLAHVQRTWRDADRMARLHERAQYAFSTLEPELQMAGYFGPAADPQPGSAVPDALLAECGAHAILPLRPALRVLPGGWSLPCRPMGGGASTGSDVLILHRASSRISPADGALQLNDSSHEAGQRNLIVRIFYVARSADGDSRTPALRVKSLSAIAGAPAFIDTEVMPGVSNLQIELLPDTVAPRSVRVRLQIIADSADTPAGMTPPELAVERRFNLRNVSS